MKKLCYLAAIALFALMACTERKDAKKHAFIAEEEVTDSTVYGVCGEGTMMHTLELITNMNDTLMIFINDEDTDDETLLVGGLMAGDRMAATIRKTADGLTAQRIINITSLLGKWSSIDKMFELTEDGEVHSQVDAESHAWTAWRILNGQLLLNRDTFDIITLGADSLELENSKGIYYFKRSRTISAEEINSIYDIDSI